MRRSSLCGALLLLAIATTNGASQPGSTGLYFLKMGGGARGVGMGEAFVAVADDATAAYWNPAGLAGATVTMVNFTHNRWFQDIRNEYLSCAFPCGRGRVAFSASYLSVGDIEYRTGPTSEPLATVSAHDLALGISYARVLTPRIRVGATVKFVHEKIYLDAASGLLADIGMIFDAALPGVCVGVAFRNAGYMTGMREERVDLPEVIQIGAAWRKSYSSFLSDIVLAMDYVNEAMSSGYGNVGIELSLERTVALRLGYQIGYDSKDFSAGTGFAVGRYLLNYAFVPYRHNLGNVHRFSINVAL